MVIAPMLDRNAKAKEAFDNDYWQKTLSGTATEHEKKCQQEEEDFSRKRRENTESGSGNILMMSLLLIFLVYIGVDVMWAFGISLITLCL
jgi:hypothetical protein